MHVHHQHLLAGVALPLYVAFAAAGAHAQQPVAQPEAESSTGPAEIIVTAQKRSERLRDVPMAIVAATSDDLAARGITSSDDLGKLVSGFSFQKSNYGLPVYYIRGVGLNETTLGVSPAVMVYVDQFPLPYSPMGRGAILDVERVEVLKGPQGTLFGQNSTGGTVNYIAAKPTSTLQAGIDATVGRFNQIDVESYVSGPLTDTLSARVALRNEYRGKWQRNYVNGDEIGEKKFTNGRLILDWTPSSSARFSFMASAWQDRSDTQQPQLALLDMLPNGRPPAYPIEQVPYAPANARAAGWDSGRDFSRNDRFHQLALSGQVELSDRITLNSLTSYSKFRTLLPQDLDGTIYPITVTTDHGRITSFSQELRLSGNFDNHLRWMIGGSYQRDIVDETLVFDPSKTSRSNLRVGPFDFPYDRFDLDNKQKIRTKAVFGSIDVPIVEGVTFQGSARYTRQDRSFTGCTRDTDGVLAAGFGFLSTVLTGAPQTIAPGSCISLDANNAPQPVVNARLDEDNFAWRGSLNWKLTPDHMIYANVTKGYKSGSFPTLPAPSALALQGIPQESVLAYEAGFKASLANRMLSIDGAIFHYDYRDKQLLGYLDVPPFGALPSLVSIPKSIVQGAELALAAEPFAGLRISANGSYLRTKVKSDPVNPTGPAGTLGTFVGQKFPYTPKWQGTLDAQYEFPLSSTANLYVGTTLTSRSKVSTTLLSGAPGGQYIEKLMFIRGYSLIDLRAGVELDDGALRIEAWGRNVGNRYYQTSITRVSDFVFRFAGEPATYGLTLRYKYR